MKRTQSVTYDILDHPIRSNESIDANTSASILTEYDANENVASVILANGTIRRYEYDPLDRPITETVESATGAVLSTTHTVYDANGNAIARTDALGNVTATEYD